MKTQTKLTILKSIMAVGVGIIAFAPAYKVLAWGPERETFNWDTAAPYRTINSITDNPSLGDERNFVRVRKVGDEKFINEVDIEPGGEYEVEIFYHNNASASLNESGAGIADGVRVNSILPDFVGKGVRGEISATITAANTKPTSVWDEAWINAKEDVYIRFISGSATIVSGGTINGHGIAMENLFSAEGANVGYWKESVGMLPGCNQYAGYVSYKFKVVKPGFEMEKVVSRDAKNEWVENIGVGPGEVVDFKIRYKNTGGTEQKDVIITDKLPVGLEYLAGTTFLINGANPGGVFVSDDLFGTGLNLGNYQPGSEAIITYKARVAKEEALRCGENKLLNDATVTTTDGSMTDEAEVTVVRTCAATELPKTGPMEITLAVVAVLAIGIGGTYWWRSNKMLRDARKAVGVEKDEEE